MMIGFNCWNLFIVYLFIIYLFIDMFIGFMKASLISFMKRFIKRS